MVAKQRARAFDALAIREAAVEASRGCNNLHDKSPLALLATVVFSGECDPITGALVTMERLTQVLIDAAMANAETGDPEQNAGALFTLSGLIAVAAELRSRERAIGDAELDLERART